MSGRGGAVGQQTCERVHFPIVLLAILIGRCDRFAARPVFHKGGSGSEVDANGRCRTHLLLNLKTYESREVLVRKYTDHLPLYRQAAAFLRDADIDLSRKTPTGWAMRAGELLTPSTWPSSLKSPPRDTCRAMSRRCRYPIRTRREPTAGDGGGHTAHRAAVSVTTSLAPAVTMPQSAQGL